MPLRVHKDRADAVYEDEAQEIGLRCLPVLCSEILQLLSLRRWLESSLERQVQIPEQ